MIRKIDISQKDEWKEVISRFPRADVYYFAEYVEAFRLHGDGLPFLLHWQSEGNEGVCVMMLRDVACDKRFEGKIPKNKYFDALTPYGYGGFLFKNDPSESETEGIRRELIELLQKEGVIAIFFRFHPVLNNADFSRGVVDVTDLGKTIALDLESPEVIWANITSKCRNIIRKAEKNGVEIHHGKEPELFERFREIYNATMADDNAGEYYYFKPEFYESVANHLSGNYEMFYATLNGEIIAMSIMIYANGYLNYHLSGSVRAYRNLGPSNLLLYKAALWGCENGMKTFHLGGGVGSGEDNLYKFKASFNRNSDYQFSIGRKIIDPEKYDYLCSLRSGDRNFDDQSKFFPLYRS